MTSVFETVTWEKVQASGEQEILPPGEYNLIIVSAEERETKAGGTLLRVCFHVKDGDHANKSVWDNFNVKNSNETAQNIALAAIKSIFLSNGLEKITDASELIGMSCRAKVTIETSEQYGSQNRLRIIRPKKAKAATDAF